MALRITLSHFTDQEPLKERIINVEFSQELLDECVLQHFNMEEIIVDSFRDTLKIFFIELNKYTKEENNVG